MSIKRIWKRVLRALSSDLDADMLEIRSLVLNEPVPAPSACDDEELRILCARSAREGVAFPA